MSSHRDLPQPKQAPKHFAIAKKPIHRQLSRGGGRFTCRHCSRQFKRRYHLKRHETIHTRSLMDIEPRFRHLAREMNITISRTRYEQPPERSRNVPRGRRRLAAYLCRGCPKSFDTYSKKRDHQKHCLKKKTNVTVLSPDADAAEDNNVMASICTGEDDLCEK